jgi:hypothetical protein
VKHLVTLSVVLLLVSACAGALYAQQAPIVPPATACVTVHTKGADDLAQWSKYVLNALEKTDATGQYDVYAGTGTDGLPELRVSSVSGIWGDSLGASVASSGGTTSGLPTYRWTMWGKNSPWAGAFAIGYAAVPTIKSQRSAAAVGAVQTGDAQSQLDWAGALLSPGSSTLGINVCGVYDLSTARSLRKRQARGLVTDEAALAAAIASGVTTRNNGTPPASVWGQLGEKGSATREVVMEKAYRVAVYGRVNAGLFDFQGPGSSGATETVRGGVIAPALGFQFLLVNPDAPGTHVGVELGYTGRLLVGDIAQEDDFWQRNFSASGKKQFWGPELTFFMRREHATPYVRMTRFSADNLKVRGFSGWQVVFGTDVF